jgi:signal transduction histidine kinase
MFPVGDDPMGENLARVLSEANGHLRTAATALRNICLGLYPPFRDQGMQLTVQEIAREFEEKHGLDITLILDHYPQSADVHSNDASAIAVSRILSEALKNVVKHAPDASVWVQLDAGEENLYLSVADNGPGVRDLSLSELIRQKHLGIVGMHEAARYAGGHLKLRASKPHGLEVFFTCPLPPHSLA